MPASTTVESSGATPSRARLIWGFVLSAMPRLGHIYARLWTAGVVLFGLDLAWVAMVRGFTRLVAPTPWAIVVVFGFCLLGIAAQLAIAIDAVRRNRTALTRPRPRWFRSTWFSAVIYVGVVASIGTSLGWRGFFIPSASMEPTLQAGDYIYTRVVSPPALPSRGSIVVFHTVREPDVEYIKRLIGLPGDRVALHGGSVLLNGMTLPRVGAGTFTSSVGDGTSILMRRFTETLTDGPSYATLKAGPNSLADDMAEVTVPPGRMFVLGDNRDNSLDSRFPQMGLVPVDHLVSTMGTIYWSRDLTRLLQPVQ